MAKLADAAGLSPAEGNTSCEFDSLPGHIPSMQTRAFVLSSETAGEVDRSYRLLAEDLGVVEAFSKSVKKPTSKLSGHLEPPHLVWLELIEANRGWQITTALEEKNYPDILASPDILRMVLQAAFIMKELVPISHPEPELWKLWQELLRRANASRNGSRDQARGLFAQFLMRFLSHLGFFANPTACSSCGRIFQKDESVIVQEEGLLCASCAANEPESLIISPKLRALIKTILSGEWLHERNSADYGLWKIARHFVEIARRLMV